MKRFVLTVLMLAVLACSGEGRAEALSSWTLSLHSALTGVAVLRVRSGGTCHRRPKSERTLLLIPDATVIASVIQHIAIEDPKSGFECKCCGNPTLEFYRHGKLLVSLGVHHGRSLRWLQGQWRGDAMLTEESATFLNQWLAERGITEPKQEYDAEKMLKSSMRN